MRQTTSWNCGVFALKYFLELFKIYTPNHESLEEELNCTKKDGTSHRAIYRYLKSHKIKYTVKHELDAPMLVNYQYDNDGHYGVILSMQKGLIRLWNPYTGKIEQTWRDDFEPIWYSKRYGKSWGILINKEL